MTTLFVVGRVTIGSPPPSGPAMHSKLQAAHLAEERSPLEYSSGIYIVDSTAQGGAAAFTWFLDDQEALSHLRIRLVDFYLDADHDRAEVVAVSAAVGTALQGVDRLVDIQTAALDIALEGLCEVRWAGSLHALRVGDGPFERSIQAAFDQNHFGDERGQSDSDWDDFVCHLNHYNG